MQATKVAVKKVKTAIEKVQSTKVKKAATAYNNVQRTLTKTTRKKRKLNKIPNTSMATQEDKDHMRQEYNFALSGLSIFV